jgi:CBS domain-containing protein
METPPPGSARTRVVEELRSADRLDPLDRYQPQLLATIREALAAGEDVLVVSGRVADANDALVRRLLELAEAHLGEPPLPYRWLALGSHGRREQVLSSDQDHAIAYAPPTPHRAGEAQEYFSRLAAIVVPALARAGLPECTGGYMATNWCRPLPEYERMFRGWVDEPRPLALLQAEVFLDTRGCHGDLDTEVLDRILQGGGARGPFRVQLARAAVTFRPPLRWPGRLRASAGAVDVKLGGTAAIVLLARLYALAVGSTEHSTVPRLRAAAAGGSLATSAAEELVEAYRFLTDLRLRHQVEQVSSGLAADNRVPLDRLDAEQRQRLRSSLRLVRDLQDVTAMRFATTTVM